VIGESEGGVAMYLVFVVEGATKSFVFPTEQIRELSIGRSEPSSGYLPDVDLTQHAAKEKGVSRRHAAVKWHKKRLCITDLDSANGTFINGVQLTPHQLTPLRSKTILQLGRLLLFVGFVSTLTT
jgi:pSer/pThr/pTyr-binding forkhead associated (FHA) protein